MSVTHGEKSMQPPLGEYAKFIKNLIPPTIPESFTLNPMFKNIASEASIRNGTVAFRDFLYVLCDRLIADGDMYAKPKKVSNPDSYPFLHDINNMLIHIGCNGKLSDSGRSLIITEPAPKISAPKQKECMQFLALCGFVFTDTEVSYPGAPMLPTGLKALSISAKELQVTFYNNAANLLRCDYRVMMAEAPDPLEYLKDILHPLPDNVQEFAIGLHRRYVEMGMTCVITYDNTNHFSYSYVKNSKRALSKRDIYQQRVWEFAVSMKYGYCIAVRAKKTDKYADVIEKFPLYLQDKIAQGYGCDRKLRGERCRGGCQGIRIPLDDRAVEMKRDIETWLDNELPNAIKK